MQLIDLLVKVKNLQYSATSNSNSGWNAKGSGQVAIEIINPQVVIIKESGFSQLEGGAKLKFSNVYRWTSLGNSRTSLEHLRLGLENPLHLFNLVQITEKNWKSEEPHLCGMDIYSAMLELVDSDTLKLDWEVFGQFKDERICYVYGLEP